MSQKVDLRDALDIMEELYDYVQRQRESGETDLRSTLFNIDLAEERLRAVAK